MLFIEYDNTAVASLADRLSNTDSGEQLIESVLHK